MTQETAAGSIDVHAHIAPLSFLQEVKRSARSLGVEVEEGPKGYAITFPNLPRIRPAGGGLVETRSRAEWMESEGVGAQYMAAWLDIQGYALPREKESSWVRLLNEHIARAAAEGGSQFKGLASVPQRDGDLAARELEYAVNSLGMIGAMVSSDPVHIEMSDASMEPLWEAAEALNVPVLLHGASHSKWSEVGPAYLGFSLGRTLDTTVLTAKLILGGLLDRHPRLKLVLCHGGGFLPYQIGRMQLGYTRGTDKVAQLKLDGPQAYLRMLYYDTVTLNTGSLRLLLGLVGAGHIMLGSDYVWEPMGGDLMGAVEAAGLTPQERGDICTNTALELFRQ